MLKYRPRQSQTEILLYICYTIDQTEYKLTFFCLMGPIIAQNCHKSLVKLIIISSYLIHKSLALHSKLFVKFFS